MEFNYLAITPPLLFLMSILSIIKPFSAVLIWLNVPVNVSNNNFILPLFPPRPTFTSLINIDSPCHPPTKSMKLPYSARPPQTLINCIFHCRWWIGVGDKRTTEAKSFVSTTTWAKTCRRYWKARCGRCRQRVERWTVWVVKCNELISTTSDC